MSIRETVRRCLPLPALRLLRRARAGLRRLRAGQDALAADEVELVIDLVERSSLPRVLVDVGAHEGYVARRFAELGWSVHAFEPDPRHLEPLRRLSRRFPRVAIDRRAVGRETATGRPWFTSELSTGISSLLAFHDTHAETGIVDVTTVAEVVRETGLQEVGVLKIDAEGADLDVLRGVPWERLAPWVIVAEFDESKRGGHSFQDLCGYLTERGYGILVSEWHPIARYGSNHAWRRFAVFPTDLADDAAWGNVIAVRTPGLLHALRACARV